MLFCYQHLLWSFNNSLHYDSDIRGGGGIMGLDYVILIATELKIIQKRN